MTKGYKATHDYKCRDQTYEIGQEYKLDEKPILCKYGFFFCINAEHTLAYYNYNHKLKLLEIEDLSNDTVTNYDKSCSNHIRIVREITDPDELMQLLGFICTFNEKGQLLTCKNSDGFWSEQTYNEFGKELTYKNSDGYYAESTYNENGQSLTYKDSYGLLRESTYDENGNLLMYKNSKDI